MKIDIVLTSSDTSDHYLRLYPHIHKIWKEKFGLECKLILIANKIPDFLSKYNSSIILFPPIPGVHTAFIAQVIRILYPCLCNKVVLVTDVDIFPISKSYFIDSIASISNDKFVSYRSDCLNRKMISICFNVAHSDIWKGIFEINTIDEITNTIKTWYNTLSLYNGKKNCEGWFTDQQKLYEYVMKWNKGIVLLSDNNLKFNRLDKRQRSYIISNINKVKYDIKNGMYTDFHCIKPYSRYKGLITDLTNVICSAK